MPQVTIHYDTFADPAHLAENDRELLNAATAVLPQSYSPYSQFRVAAAVRMEDGEIITGVNTENAAYPVCICAERSVLAAAASRQPGKRVVSMAITVGSPRRTVDAPATPCGGCRQVLLEHETRFRAPIRLVLRGETGPTWVFDSVKGLLPFGFSGNDL